jgi:DNA-3-methyladenine glycosylase II
MTATLERLLGLRIDLRNFYRLAAEDRQLSTLSRRLRGLKPARYPTIFECLINAIACQQITLALGILLLSRLAERYGARFGPGAHAFPRPEDLVDAAPEDLRALGFSRQKAKAIIMLAGDVASGGLDLDALTLLDDDTAVERLLTLPGIGRWSAEYVLLRGMGRLHAFPGDDVGARKNLERWLGLRRSLDYEGVRQILARWAPYGGLVYFHLLIDRLMESGRLNGPGGG